MKSALVTLYVMGQELAPDLLSPSELTALLTCVRDLFSTYSTRISFDVDTSADEDGATIVLVHCLQEDEDGFDVRRIPFPNEWIAKTMVFGLKSERRLIGDRLPVVVGFLDRAEVLLTPYD